MRKLQLLILGPSVLAAAWILSGHAGAPGQEPPAADQRLRRPVALLLADGGTRLLVANRDSGTVAVVDTHSLRAVAEMRVGRRLSDMAANRDRDLLVVSDQEAGEVIVLSRRQAALCEVRRLKVGVAPVSVQVSDDGGQATVACLWSRRLVILDLSAGKLARGQAALALDLPFAPRRQLLVPGTGKLVVADAFGDRLAVVDLRRRKVESVRSLAGHNFGGPALDRQRKGLLLTHQLLHEHGRTTSGDIRNGSLVSNHVRRLSLAAVLDPSADALRDERLYTLGDVERGAGDPGRVAETEDGQVLVTLAGVHELAIGRPEQAIWTRLPVGRRPTALAVDRVGGRAYVANTFGDSVSVIDWQARKVIAEIPLGVQRDLRQEERGELLFYDATLSFESWFSCHSCHPDGHTNGRLNDNLTDGSFGTPKRVLSLLGVKDTGPWAWSGRMKHLEDQVRTSLTSTMQGPAPSAAQVRDLTAFLKTLAPPPAVLQAREMIDVEARDRGRRVFVRENCATCHVPPTYTSPHTYDVGLRDEAGGSRFNPPSLRGLSQAGPYFHDNRAVTLEEVVTRHSHRLPHRLSDRELADLLHFLQGL
jgi:YVTN family beta-propeller protein